MKDGLTDEASKLNLYTFGDATIEGSGFGLVPIKPEGERISFDNLESKGDKAPAPKTRWIEMCYNPSEDMSHIDLGPFREVFQTQQSCNGYTDDDIYLIIKSIANEFINDEGF
jgi:hypothetical protein